MKIDDSLKVEKVRCVNAHSNCLTVGKEYSVLDIRMEVKVKDDKNDNCYWKSDHFEPVSDPAEKLPQVAEPKFAAGEKVYFSTDPDIKIVSDVNNDNTVRFFGEFGWADSNHCCPATQENYEKLCSLFECIDFEQPPTQADIDNEAVDKLAQAMKDKLAKKREQGYHGWETCKHGDLVQLLINHVDKGDPIDVANFCAFLFARGESLTGGGIDEQKP